MCCFARRRSWSCTGGTNFSTAPWSPPLQSIGRSVTSWVLTPDTAPFYGIEPHSCQPRFAHPSPTGGFGSAGRDDVKVRLRVFSSAFLIITHLTGLAASPMGPTSKLEAAPVLRKISSRPSRPASCGRLESILVMKSTQDGLRRDSPPDGQPSVRDRVWPPSAGLGARPQRCMWPFLAPEFNELSKRRGKWSTPLRPRETRREANPPLCGGGA